MPGMQVYQRKNYEQGKCTFLLFGRHIYVLMCALFGRGGWMSDDRRRDLWYVRVRSKK